jgi:hypothetical protein
MNILFIIATVLAVATSLKAQTTITGTSPIGYTVKLSIADAATARTAPFGTTGANVVWDCRNLISSTSGIDLRVDTPSGRPFANQFPSSNWNLNGSLGGTIIYNEYFVLNAENLLLLGGHTPNSYYEIYENPQLDMKFPFSYEDSQVDAYSKTKYNADGSVSSSQVGTVTISYVGYGTLILPIGTFTNVALLKESTDKFDRSYNNSVLVGYNTRWRATHGIRRQYQY